MAEAGEVALNAAVAPGRVLGGEVKYQGADRSTGRRSSQSG